MISDRTLSDRTAGSESPDSRRTARPAVVSFRIDPEVLAVVDELADREQMNRSAVLTEALHDFASRHA